MTSPSEFSATDQLFQKPAFDDDGWDFIFSQAMKEAFQYHYEHSLEFRGHAELAKFQSTQISSLKDVENIPWIFVQNFKEAHLLSVSESEIVRTFTSSGTGGSKTQLFLDDVSLNRICVAAQKVYEGLGILENTGPCNYLLFTYNIKDAPDLGTAWTDVMIASMVAAQEMAFLINKVDGEFKFDLELALSKYQEFIESGKPLRLLGFPAFMHHTFNEAQKRGLPKLSPQAAKESWILTGGGWKNHQGTTIPKLEFARFANLTTGIPIENVRDLFGMSEHGVGYVDCAHGRLHIPIYAHALTRDPFTLKIQPLGTPGLLQLFTPLLKSYPSLSLLTTDEVIIDDAPCACGIRRPSLEYVGRVGIKNYEGCAIRALEYLKV